MVSVPDFTRGDNEKDDFSIFASNFADRKDRKE